MTPRKLQKVVPGAALVLALASGSFVAMSQVKSSPENVPRPVQVEGFSVVGIAIRTSNAEQASPEAPIGKMWQRFFHEGVLAAIPNKADANIVALYTEYSSDKDGAYTYVLGARVTKVEAVPPGMVAKDVPAGKYALFTSERGPAPKVVPEMWRRVWSVPKDALGGERAYQTDYELYDERARNPADSVVDLYIGVR